MVKDENRQHKYPLACYVVGIVLLGYVLIAVAILIAVHLGIILNLQEGSLLRAHVMCGAFGMLGATVAAIRKYYRVLITESVSLDNTVPTNINWELGWVYYYLSRPLLGSLLGALTYMLSYIGVQVLASPSKIQITIEGSLLLYAIAVMSGYAVSHVLDRLEELSKQLFQSKQK